MTKKTRTDRMLDTLIFIVNNPGCTQRDVIEHVYRDVRSRNYGRQRNASAAIAKLRFDGLLVDDCERCAHCGRASRSRRDVALFATKAGEKLISLAA